jgi:C4-dicarboxylate-specific signal transduction histidine kinase
MTLPMGPDPMTLSPPALAPDDWRRLRDALRYQCRDLHHRSYAVTSQRRELLWEEMDHCLALADRIEAQILARRGDLPTARQRLTAAIRAWDRQLPAEQQELFFDLALAPSLQALRQDGSIEQILRLHGLAQDPLTAVGFLPRP